MPRELRGTGGSDVQHQLQQQQPSVDRSSVSSKPTLQPNGADRELRRRRFSLSNVLAVFASEVDRLRCTAKDSSCVPASLKRSREEKGDNFHVLNEPASVRVKAEGEQEIGPSCGKEAAAEDSVRVPTAYETLLSILSGENVSRILNQIRMNDQGASKEIHQELVSESIAPESSFLSLDLETGAIEATTGDGEGLQGVTDIAKEMERIAVLRLPLHRSRFTSEDAIVDNILSLVKDPTTRYGTLVPMVLRMAVRSKVKAMRASRNAVIEELKDLEGEVWKPRMLEAVDEESISSGTSRSAIAEAEMDGKNVEYLLEGALASQLEDEISQLARERCNDVLQRLTEERDYVHSSFSDLMIGERDMEIIHWLYMEYNSFDAFTVLFGSVICNMIVRCTMDVSSTASFSIQSSSLVQRFAFEASRWIQSQLTRLSLTTTGRLNESRWLYMMSFVVAIRQHLAALPEYRDNRTSKTNEKALFALDVIRRAFELLQRSFCRLVAPMMAFASTIKLAGAIEGEDAVLPGDLFIHRDVFWDAMAAYTQNNASGTGGAGDDSNPRLGTLDDTRKSGDREGMGSNKQGSKSSLRTQSLISLWFAWRKAVRPTGVLPTRSAVEDVLTAQRFAAAVMAWQRKITQRGFSLMLRVCQELSKARVTVETTGLETSSFGDAEAISLYAQHSNVLQALRDYYSAAYGCGKGCEFANVSNPYIRAQRPFIVPGTHAENVISGEAHDTLTNERDVVADWMLESFYFTYASSCFPVLSIQRQSHLIESLILLSNLVNREDDRGGSEGLSSFSETHVENAVTDAIKVASVGCSIPGVTSTSDSPGDEDTDATAAQTTLLDMTKQLHIPLRELLAASQERLRCTVCDIIRSDLRCLMCVFHSVFTLLERSTTTTIDAKSVLWNHVLPTLAELCTARSLTQTEPCTASKSACLTLRRRRIVEMLKMVSSCGLLQLSWNLHDTALAVTRFSHWRATFNVSEEEERRNAHDFETALEALRSSVDAESEVASKLPKETSLREEGGMFSNSSSTSSSSGGGQASSKALVGAQDADAQLLEHILSQSPTYLASPAPALLMLSFSRLLLTRLRHLRQQWEESIVRELSLADDANEGGAYYTAHQNAQVSRGLTYCTTRDKFIFSSYMEVAHRMLFSYSVENLPLLPFWMSTLFHLFTVVVPPPVEETDEEDVERIPGSAIALESIRRENRKGEGSGHRNPSPPSKDYSDPEALRRRHVWRYYRRGPNVSPQGGLRAILGEQLANLVVLAHTDTPALVKREIPGRNTAEKQQDMEELQRVLPIEVLSLICMFIGREVPSSTSAGGCDGSLTRGNKAQRKRSRIFLGAVGLLALCHRLDQFIVPSSIRDTRVLQYLEELWEAADDAVNGEIA